MGLFLSTINSVISWTKVKEFISETPKLHYQLKNKFLLNKINNLTKAMQSATMQFSPLPTPSPTPKNRQIIK